MKEYYVLRVNRHNKLFPNMWDEYYAGTDYTEAVVKFLLAWDADPFDLELVQRTDVVRRYRCLLPAALAELEDSRG